MEHGHAAGKRREPGRGGREEAVPGGAGGRCCRDVMRRRVGEEGNGPGDPGIPGRVRVGRVRGTGG